MRVGIKYSSIFQISQGGLMGPIMWRHYVFKCMPIAASGASTSLTGSTLRRSCHQNSSFSYPFR